MGADINGQGTDLGGLSISGRVPGCFRMKLAPQAMIVLTLGALASPALAQDGTVQGRVRDEEGSAVIGASVVLSSGENALGSTGTDQLGSFRIPDVPRAVQVECLGARVLPFIR